MISAKEIQDGVLRKKLPTVKPGSEMRRDLGLRVRLIKPALRLPAIVTENIVVNLLTREQELPLEKLIALVADALYRDELRMGAWALDLGLFGSSLFVSEARRALETGDGELWKIH